jgi:hypothetical protein
MEKLRKTRPAGLLHWVGMQYILPDHTTSSYSYMNQSINQSNNHSTNNRTTGRRVCRPRRPIPRPRQQPRPGPRPSDGECVSVVSCRVVPCSIRAGLAVTSNASPLLACLRAFILGDTDPLPPSAPPSAHFGSIHSYIYQAAASYVPDPLSQASAPPPDVPPGQGRY